MRTKSILQMKDFDEVVHTGLVTWDPDARAEGMNRLPPIPDLDWRDDGSPISTVSDDVYFSADDGLAETRAVFLSGCALPDRWRARDRFTVAELGFGTGLNLLALWDLWQRTRPAPNAWLHMVSFEGAPLTTEQASRALSKWPELLPFADKLLAVWPDRARGVRRLDWPDDGISLTLHVDDVAGALPAGKFKADAWFLDGFSPAKNESMWAETLYPLIAERSAPDARIGTYTVAGHVRRGLSDAGFDIAKQPGHGRKRERLEARFTGMNRVNADPFALRGPDVAPKRIAILGGGIAGASAANILASYGADVSVFDPAPAVAAGASGNAMALLMPRLDAADTVQARLLIDAYLHARSVYAGHPGTTQTDVQQIPRDDADTERFAKILADPPLPLEDLEALPGGALLHKRALILRPPALIGSLLGSANSVLGTPVKLDLANRTVNGDVFDAIILANGMAVQSALPWLALTAKLGQVEHVHAAAEAPPSALASGHYAIADGLNRLWGATFETHDGPPETKPEAQATNAAALSALSPWWLPQIRGAGPTSRAGIRATTPDRLPLIGAVPDEPAARAAFAPLKTGQAVKADAPVMAGIYMVTGFGSRGFTWGPWAGSILASQLFGAPAPAPIKALEAVSPMRQIRRALKRGHERRRDQGKL